LILLIFTRPVTLIHLEIHVFDLVGQLIEPEQGTVGWILTNLDVLMPDGVGASVEDGNIDLGISLLSN